MKNSTTSKEYLLEINDISKAFREYRSEWHRILSWFGLDFKPKEEHSILKHINFSIEHGEAVGIVGQNGAGKSTLLKIITGTLRPSSGLVSVRGRISAILELGMGFHPDLTGRQNVYHSAGLMGFTHEQIDAVIDEIEEFSEIDEYFDQPVRTYSSGMQMRVAFSVATAYRPEILIVDEALSVGDAYFQHKSFSRIREFQEQGTTLLLVSHDRGAIQAICDRAILLEDGSVIRDGNPEDVMDYYNALIADKENSRLDQIEHNGRVETISGTGEATISAVGLYNIEGERVEFLSVNERVELRVRVDIHQDISELVLGYMIKNRLGQTVYGTNTHHLDQVSRDLQKGESLFFNFAFDMNLGLGSYSMAVAVHTGPNHFSINYEWRDNALIFTVANNPKEPFDGVAWLSPILDLSIKK